MSDTFNFGYTAPTLDSIGSGFSATNSSPTSGFNFGTNTGANTGSSLLNFDLGLSNSPAGSNNFDLGFGLDTGAANSGSSFLGLDSSTWGGIGQGVGIASNMFNAFNAFQSSKLAQDQFDFQKQAWQDQYNLNLEEYEYQKEKRDARSDAYAAAKTSATKQQLG